MKQNINSLSHAHRIYKKIKFYLQLDTFAGGMSSYFGGGNDKSAEADDAEPYAGKIWNRITLLKQ